MEIRLFAVRLFTVVAAALILPSSVSAAKPIPVSPDGAMVPTTTSQIVDNSGAVWTIASNYAILRDGTSAAGGYGSKIYWKNSTIYVYGTDNNWWQWTGSGWSNIGPTQPGTGTSTQSSVVSPAGGKVECTVRH